MEYSLLREYIKLRRQIGGLIFGIIRNGESTEDLLQDLAVVVAKEDLKAEGRGIKDPRRWLFRRAGWMAMNHLKKNRRERMRLDGTNDMARILENASGEFPPEAREIAVEIRAARSCMKRMSERQKMMFQARVFDALSYETLSRKFKGSPVVLRKAFSRLRRKLADCIEEKIRRWSNDRA